MATVLKHLMIVLCAAFAVAATAFGPALAQSSECRSLASQISAAGRSGNPGLYGKYAKAVSAQQAQMRKLQGQMRQARCTGNSGTPTCRSLAGTMRKMQSNLSALASKRDSYASKGNGAKFLLEARFRLLGCDASSARRVDTVKLTPQEKPKTSGIAREIGTARKPQTPAIPGLSFNGRTFRTLCVRTCDGYYFPISFSTTQDNFSRDEAACNAMCPGTEARLFVHDVPEQESEDMVSLAGEPYRELPNAFAYRRDGLSDDPACSCGGNRNFIALNRSFTIRDGEAIAEQAAKEAKREEEDIHVPVPTPRPSPAIDAETALNLAGAFGPDEIRRMFNRDKGRQVIVGDRGPVRVVGPEFLPDPEGAIDLRAPARSLLPSTRS